MRPVKSRTNTHTLTHARNIFVTEDKISYQSVGLQYHWTYVRLRSEFHNPSQHTALGHYLPTSETPYKWRFAGGPIVARFNMFCS